MMQKKKMKYIGAMALVSSTLLFTGCTPYPSVYNNGYGYNGYGNVVASSMYIGIYDYPRYIDSPYYYYNKRYYYGGYYRNGYYHYRGDRYRNGRYYHRGYRYHHRRHNQNVDLLRRGDRNRYNDGDRRYKKKDKRYKKKDRYNKPRKKNSSRKSNRDRNVNLLRR